MPLLLFIGIMVFFFFYEKRGKKNQDLHIVRKLVFTGILGVINLLVIWIFIVTLSEVKDTIEVDSLAFRLRNVDYASQKGDYTEMASELRVFENYEEDFEPYWEESYHFMKDYYHRIYEEALESCPDNADFAEKEKIYRP